MNDIKPQKAIEYSYKLGILYQSVLTDENEKLSTKQITELWDIQEKLGLAELQFNRKEDVLKDITECYASLLSIATGDEDG